MNTPLYFITGNIDKFNEVKSIIPEIIQLKIDLPEIQSLSSEEVIKAKLDYASNVQTGSFIVEDGTLSLDALNGLPGTLIKWFLKTIGNDGLLKICEKYNNFSASTTVTIGFKNNTGDKLYFEGAIKGTIVSPRGILGWGWDPIFLPEGYNKTFGEMSQTEKNKVSMRIIAAKKLRDYLYQHDSKN